MRATKASIAPRRPPPCALAIALGVASAKRAGVSALHLIGVPIARAVAGAVAGVVLGVHASARRRWVRRSAQPGAARAAPKALACMFMTYRHVTMSSPSRLSTIGGYRSEGHDWMGLLAMLAHA